jgi:hypothetical protein
MGLSPIPRPDPGADFDAGVSSSFVTWRPTTSSISLTAMLIAARENVSYFR